MVVSLNSFTEYAAIHRRKFSPENYTYERVIEIILNLPTFIGILTRIARFTCQNSGGNVAINMIQLQLLYKNVCL